MCSQALTFLTAGFETTSSTIYFALYELAMNPDTQERLRRNIKEVLLKHNGQITYEAISDMDYLSQTVDGELI